MIRAATAADLASITAIYNEAIAEGGCTRIDGEYLDHLYLSRTLDG